MWEEDQLRATLDAIDGIQRLPRADVQRTLSQRVGKSLVAPFPHGTQPLNTYREDFWQQVFTDLFPFGDCREKDPRRKQTMGEMFAISTRPLSLATTCRIYCLVL